MRSAHPLADMLTGAAEGRFPPIDGGVDVLPPDEDGTWAIVEFTGHAVILGDVEPAAVAAAGADGFGGAGHPDVQRLLAGPNGWIGCHDAVLVHPFEPSAEATLEERSDLDDHPRVVRARQHRQDVRVYADDTGLVVTGRGLVGRSEIAVESFGGRGTGRRLISAALATGEGWCFAQVSPGNAASLRAFLAAGFVPVASEVLIHPTSHPER